MRNQTVQSSGYPINILKLGSLLLMLCIFGQTTAQERKDLESLRNKLIAEIESTQNSLRETSINKNQKLQELNILENKIDKRKKLLSNISTSLQMVKDEISQNDSTLISLADNISQVKEQYHKLLRYSYLKKISSNKWSYILSSKNLNDAFLRWRYTRQFEQYCLDKAEEISSLQVTIDEKNKLLKESKQQQESLMVTESDQMKILNGDQKHQKRLLNQLSKEESTLKKTLDRQKKERESLNKEIEDAIIKEMSKNTNNEAAARENLNLADAFAKNKGMLPWPAPGNVKSKFGVQPHPSVAGLKIDNNGIDIITNIQGADITAIYSGKVIGITTIPGYDYMVIVQHGNYYTVYSKLISVYVRTDQNISTGQLLGKLASDKNEVHIELWKNKSKIDPQEWLRK